MAAPTYGQGVVAARDGLAIGASGAAVALAGAATAGSLVLLTVLSREATAGWPPAVTITESGWRRVSGFDDLTQGSTVRVETYWRLGDGTIPQATPRNDGASAIDALTVALAEYRWPGAQSWALASSGENRQEPAPGFGTGPSINYGAGPRAIVGLAGVAFDPVGAASMGIIAGGAPTQRLTLDSANGGGTRLYFGDLLVDAGASSSQFAYINTDVKNTLSYGMEWTPSTDPPAPFDPPTFAQGVTAARTAILVGLTGAPVALAAAAEVGSIVVLEVAARETAASTPNVGLVESGWTLVPGCDDVVNAPTRLRVQLYTRPGDGTIPSATPRNDGTDTLDIVILAMAEYRWPGANRWAIASGPSETTEQPAPGFSTGPVIAYGANPRFVLGVSAVAADPTENPVVLAAVGPTPVRRLWLDGGGGFGVRVTIADALLDEDAGATSGFNYIFTGAASTVAYALTLEPVPAPSFFPRFF